MTGIGVSVAPGAVVGLYDAIENLGVVGTRLMEGSGAEMLGNAGANDTLGWFLKVCDAVGSAALPPPECVLGGGVDPTCNVLGEAVVTSGKLVVSGKAVGRSGVVGSVEITGISLTEGSDVGLFREVGKGLTLGCCLILGHTVASGEVLGSADEGGAKGTSLRPAFGALVAPAVASGLYDVVGSANMVGCRLVEMPAVGDSVRRWVGPLNALGCTYVGAVETLGWGLRVWVSSFRCGGC